MFKAAHFKAILFRRFTLMKRSWKLTLLSIIGVIVASILAIVINYLMKILLEPKAKYITFRDLDAKPPSMVVFDDGTYHHASKIIEIVNKVYQQEVGSHVEIFKFDSRDALNEFIYQHQIEFKEPSPIQVAFGMSFQNLKLQFATFYNTTDYLETNDMLESEFLPSRGIWKFLFGEENDFRLSVTELATRNIAFGFGMSGPIIIVAGLIAIIPMIINQPITDLTGEVRSYMVSCTLTIFPYWIATFLIDFALWFIVCTLMWIIYVAAQIQAFHDNLLLSWYTIIAAGPSFILFIYCVSFLFSNPESANRQTFLIFMLTTLVPFIIEMIRFTPNPEWLEWVYSFIPFLCIQRTYSTAFQLIGPQKQPFDYFWTTDIHTRPHLIMELVNIVIYGSILVIIESVRLTIQNKMARHSFGNYTEIFKEIREKNDITPEVAVMEEEVRNSHDYAIRIEDVSRLFFNTEGKPIPAVNCVTLGVKQGSLFGFLGANGAGKTTLIRMITKLLPPSEGSIEINGKDINEFNDPTVISICPQFNNHLCKEMTPDEHFKLYGFLFELEKNELIEKRDNLIRSLELESIRDKPLQDLSQGDVRKLAIALSFFGPASIILLDEPTASLDPVARHNVHEMIQANRSNKTFMLCTHLLSEAEVLCDTISIMVRGCVFTTGSPSALTEKFGKNYKIDVMLEDFTDEVYSKCDAFFEQHLPTATLSIQRPKARIYDVPAQSIELHALFDLMEKGLASHNGFKYYTCSSSSLERVFMEIVKMSEEADTEFP